MSDLMENINRYIIGYAKQPKVNDMANMTDKIMNVTAEMEKFLSNITDDRKRESMKRNVSLMQQLLIDNMEAYNEWLQKMAREQK